MPKLRRAEASRGIAGSVPADLLNADSKVWASVPATTKWLQAQGLTIGVELAWGPINRRKASAQAWMKQNGLHSTLSNGYVAVDWRRGLELGLPVSGGSGIEERMAHAGVTITRNEGAVNEQA